MSDENPKPSELYEEKEENRYQRKGSPQISLNKFEALKSRKAKRRRFKIHPHIKVILFPPLMFLLCFSLFFVPYIVYKIATGTPAPKKEEVKKSIYYNLAPVKPNK